MLQYILNVLGRGSYERIQRGNGIEFQTTHPEIINAIGFVGPSFRTPSLINLDPNLEIVDFLLKKNN